MTEIILVLIATVIVFSLFLLIFFIKDRSGGDTKDGPACARCDCQRGQQQPARPLRHIKQFEKESRPFSSGR